MKKKNFFMLALAAMAFAACSNEDLVPTDNPGGDNQLVTDPTGDAWVALAVKTPQTRALHDPNQEPATEAESKITKVRAIFFTANDANEDAATVTADITLTNDQAGLGSNGIPSGAGKAFKVPATSKRILIIANPSARFEAKTASTDGKWPAGTTTYATVNAALDDTAGDLSTAGSFMMSNSKGSLEPSNEDENHATLNLGDPIDLSLYKTEAAANSNPLSIRIDRVVAKVRVYITTTSEAKATISDAGWILNATNKTYFPISKRTLTWNEKPENKNAGIGNAGRGTCIIPFDQYKIGSYRIDPNYDTQVLTNYNAYDSNSDVSLINWNLDKASEYCLENTQTAEHNMHAYTTHVLLKARFIPSEYGLPNDGKSTDQEGESDPAGTPGKGDWMLISGGFYTYTTLMVWIEAELTEKYTDKEPATFPTTRTTALNRYLDAVGVGAVSLPAKVDDPANIPTVVAGLIQDFEDKKLLLLAKTDKERAISVVGLTYYVNAVSYYKIMIKHDDTSAAVNELGEFGVVRNSVYDINVTKFNNPGYPGIPDPEKETPDENDEGWLSIEIKTNPWTWYTQTEEF